MLECQVLTIPPAPPLEVAGPLVAFDDLLDVEDGVPVVCVVDVLLQLEVGRNIGIQRNNLKWILVLLDPGKVVQVFYLSGPRRVGVSSIRVRLGLHLFSFVAWLCGLRGTRICAMYIFALGSGPIRLIYFFRGKCFRSF